MTRWLVPTLVLIFTLPISAQRVAWEQEHPTNPTPLHWRAYFDTGPAVLMGVDCAPIASAEWHCEATLPPRVWSWLYITVENEIGESLASNVIAFQVPISSIPSAPKNLRRLP